MAMKNPPHPGSVFRQVCIEPAGITVTEAAAHLSVSRRQLSGVLNGRSGISPEMAVRISRVCGGSAKIWCLMRAAYDLALALELTDTIKVGRLRPITP